jgi:hypothetical protein
MLRVKEFFRQETSSLADDSRVHPAFDEFNGMMAF